MLTLAHYMLDPGWALVAFCAGCGCGGCVGYLLAGVIFRERNRH